jgi:glycosyltransferase involved in cell wall biosynthesis
MDERPFISVVIPVWNGADLIANCLRAIGDQTYPRDRHEVLVVDNGSVDATTEVVRSFPFATLLLEPMAGSYRARNLGLKSARGEYVAFTDADCVPDRDWLASAARAVKRHPDAGVIAGQIQLMPRSGGSAASEKYEAMFSFNHARSVAEYGICTTANWISPRDLLMDLGGFDPTLKSGGDSKLARQIRAVGPPIVYVPDMLVRHPMRGTLKELAKKQRRLIGGKWQSTQKRWRFLWCSAVVAKYGVIRIFRTAFDRRCSLLDRLEIIGVVVALSMASIVELIRLACGGEPKRA